MKTVEVKRPNANDTEENLIRMQNEMLKKKCKKQAPVTVSSNSFAEKSRKIDKLAGRFCLDLDSLAEEEKSIMELTVQERNVEFLYETDQLCDCLDAAKCVEYVEEEGFPDVLDLSSYYNDLGNAIKDFSTDGRSFFAMEFDRIHECDGAEPSTSVTEGAINDINREIELENLERIEKMSKHDIEKAKQEIVERFDSKVLDFLRNRAKKKQQVKMKQNEPISRTEKSSDAAAAVTSDVCAGMNAEINDRIKELEIFDFEQNTTLHRDSACKLNDPYLRLAADAAQMDMATKCMRTILPRQQNNIIKLFDSLQIAPKDYTGDDLLEKARANLNAIKGLYLEQREDEHGNLSVQFADDIDPFGKAVWMLSPIRKVLDVIQKDGKSTTKDLVIVRLSLFWTLLIMVERPTLYYAFATPGEIFVRLAEIFMMGPEIFKDEYVSQCLTRFLHDYLEPKARDGLLCLILSEPITGLDAFGPFYEDLLHHFEEFSMGDKNFTLFILLGAYANQRPLDSLLMKSAIWAPGRNVVRQMVLKKDSGDFLLDIMISRQINEGQITARKHFPQYEKLLRIYASAIRDGVTVKDRNQLVYEIASSELKNYIKLHKTKNFNEDLEVTKQPDTLAHTLQQSLIGYIDFS